MTNLSGTDLSPSNGATVHALVYEETKVNLTGRFVRDAPYVAINPALAHGDTRVFSLDSTPLTGVDWDKIDVIVIVDYRPGGATGPYDTLQAAVAGIPVLFSDGFESGDTTAWSSSTP